MNAIGMPVEPVAAAIPSNPTSLAVSNGDRPKLQCA